MTKLNNEYPGLALETRGRQWHVSIPDKLRTDRETHFGQVMTRFLAFLREGKLPMGNTEYDREVLHNYQGARDGDCVTEPRAVATGPLVIRS